MATNQINDPNDPKEIQSELSLNEESQPSELAEGELESVSGGSGFPVVSEIWEAGKDLGHTISDVFWNE